MSLFTRNKSTLVTPEDALPGRDVEIPTSATHYVLNTPLKPPFPDGLEQIVVGMGCFWGAERLFWEAQPGVYTTAVGYAGGITPNPTYEEVCSGTTGHTEAVLVVFDPSRSATRRCSASSGRATTRPRACARATTSAPSTARPSTRPTRRSSRRPRRSKAMFEERLGSAGYGEITTEIARGPLLLRRGVPPAVPGQEPQRVLRPGRHGRVLPGRPRRQVDGPSSEGDSASSRALGSARCLTSRSLVWLSSAQGSAA